MAESVKQKRNGEIDVFRFLFCIGILLYHFGDKFNHVVCKNGNIGVEFFFLVSGYLMAKSADKYADRSLSSSEIADDTWLFIKKKVASFYPYYLLAMFLTLVVRKIIVGGAGFFQTIKYLVRSIPYYSLTFVGLDYTYSNNLHVSSTWYLSAMLICMFIIFPLLLRAGRFCGKIVAPIVSVFLLGYLNTTYGKVIVNEQWGGIVYLALIRAMAELLLGVFVYYCVDDFLKKDAQTSESNSIVIKIIVTLIKAGAYMTVILYAKGFDFGGKFSLHALLMAALAIAFSFANIGYTIPDCRVTRFLGRISLPIYMFHGTIMHVVNDYTGGMDLNGTQLLILAGCAVILSVGLMYFTDFLAVQFRKIGSYIKSKC